jgi:hypothetical protein
MRRSVAELGFFAYRSMVRGETAGKPKSYLMQRAKVFLYNKEHISTRGPEAWQAPMGKLFGSGNCASYQLERRGLG